MDLIEIFDEQFPVITGKQILIYTILFILLGIFLGALIYKKRLKGWQAVCLLAAFTYLYLILLSTVYSRGMLKEREIELMPFWSYVYAWEHKSKAMAEEIFLNILLLIPAAVLILVTVRDSKYIKWVLIGGALTSASIEIQQLIFQRGWFEWDDMIHNTLGVGICCFVWNRLYVSRKKINNKCKYYYN